MAKTNKNNSGIDVVNPDKLNEKQLHDLDVKTEHEKDELEDRLSKTYKKMRGKLWLWWIFPIFGWLVYAMIWQNRLQREENQEKLILLKRAIAEKQIQLMLNQKRWQQIGKDNK